MESNEYIDEGEYLSDDIGRLIEILLRQWRLILATTMVCALTAGVFGYLQPKSYQATAMIASKLSTSDVSLGSTIETSSDEELITSRVIDQNMRMQSYLNLVSSPLIAQSVLDDMGSLYPEKKFSVSKLIGMVEGEIADVSDSIMIKASSGNPQMSADIANAWAQAYVGQVNSIYGTQSDIDGYNAIQEQLEKTNAEYQNAQSELENFIAENNILALTREIETTNKAIGSLSNSRDSVLSEHVKSMQESLIELYDEKSRIETYLQNAETMRSQVVTGGDGAAMSSNLALNLLKSEIFVKKYEIVGAEDRISTFGSDIVVQTDFMTTTAESMLKDLDGLIIALEKHNEILNISIEELSEELIEISNQPNIDSIYGKLLNFDYESKVLDELEKKSNTLQADLVKTNAFKQELTRKRDLAWESYKNLQIKAAELGVSLGIKKAALVFAAPAVAPRGDTSSTAKNVLIAAVVGFMFGVSAAFATEFWWRYKTIEPYPLLTRKRTEQAA